MKIALLGTGFGQADAAVLAQRPDVDQVVVFGRTPYKLATISGQFGAHGSVRSAVNVTVACRHRQWPPGVTSPVS